MNMKFDIEVISERSATSCVLLSIGYGSGHMVIQIEGEKTLENILAFIATHRADKAAHWIEIGRFGSFPVTLTVSHDWTAVVVDSDIVVGGFGQSIGLHIPGELLDEFTAALSGAHQRFPEHPHIKERALGGGAEEIATQSLDSNMGKTDQAVLARVTRSWQEACGTLGVKVVAPYPLTEGDDSTNCLAFLPDFGGPKGMVVAALVPPNFETNARLVEVARKRGFFYSSINPLGWVEYDAARPKEALEDWGYYGPADKCPGWFNGVKHATPSGD